MPDEQKIIIDEDWKSQVEAEREALQQEGASGEEEPRPQASGASGEAVHKDDPPMPPASLDLLVSTLATEAMLALGAIAHPATGKRGFHPNQAKYLIDMLAVLAEKTKGNVVAEETEAIGALLHQLRMGFIAAQGADQPTAKPAASGGASTEAAPPDDKSTGAPEA